MNVLYIDSDEELLHTAEGYLSDFGWDVDTALSAEDALTSLNSSNYDAVITEEELPGMCGAELLAHLRAAGNKVPVVFFSDTGDADAVVAALNAGATQYVRKGVAPKDALSSVRDVISRIEHGVQTFCSPLSIESEMRMILDSSDESMVFIGPNRIILWANRAFFQSLEVEPADVVGKHCHEVVWGRSAPCGTCRIPKVLSSGHSVSSEVRYPDGGTYWITTYPVKDDAGALLGYIEKVTDITVVKEAQEATRREKEKYNLLFQSANDMIYLHEMAGDGTPGRILDVNDAACRRMGYTREEFLAMDVPDINDPGLSRGVGSLASEIGGEGQVVFEWQHVTRAGEKVPVEISLNRLTLEGVSVGFSIVRDITERKDSERALRIREQEFRDLVENINEVIFRFDSEGTILYVSPAIERLAGGSGYLPADLIGRNFIDFIHPADRELLQGHFRERLSGITKRSTFRLLTRSGAVRWVLESSRPILEGGAAVGIQGVFLDITDLRMMDLALKKANKKLNILSSITRHDILNQITSMNLYLDLIEGDSGDLGKLQDFFEAAESIMGNLERIITFTRDYEDLGVKEPEWQDVGAIIDRETRSFDGTIVINNGVHGLEVYADSMLGKVFSNLVGNSVMHGVKAGYVTFSFEERGENGCIVVTDDGVGISDDMKERIFSKGVGKNTGFGLFLSREILDLTGFSIQEVGVPGVGARFEISVPEGNFRYISGV